MLAPLLRRVLVLSIVFITSQEPGGPPLLDASRKPMPFTRQNYNS